MVSLSLACFEKESGRGGTEVEVRWKRGIVAGNKERGVAGAE